MYKTRYEYWLEQVNQNKRQGKGIDLEKGLLYFDFGNTTTSDKSLEEELKSKWLSNKEKELIKSGKVVYIFVGGTCPMFNVSSRCRLNIYSDGQDLLEDMENRHQADETDTVYMDAVKGLSYNINSNTGNKRATRFLGSLLSSEYNEGDLLYVTLPAYVMLNPALAEKMEETTEEQTETTKEQTETTEEQAEENANLTEETEETTKEQAETTDLVNETTEEQAETTEEQTEEIIVQTKTEEELEKERLIKSMELDLTIESFEQSSLPKLVLDTTVVDNLDGEELYEYLSNNALALTPCKFGGTNIMKYLQSSIGSEVENEVYQKDIIVHTSVQTEEQLLYI